MNQHRQQGLEVGLLRRLIGEVLLRGRHRVYRDGEDFQVDTINEKRPSKVYNVSIRGVAVEFLYSKAKGQQITAKEATRILSEVARKFQLPYTYGSELYHYAERALLVLTTLKRASIRMGGREYIYTIE
jgi:hypothetical protein